MSTVTNTGSYWNSEGRYQKQYDAAWQNLIPVQGACDDPVAEALRCISRIAYDYYNNGFCNLWNAWDDIDDHGYDYTEYRMNSYYEDLLDGLAVVVSPRLCRQLEEWLPTQQGHCSWFDGRDSILDQIVDDVLKQLMADGTILAA